MTFKEKKQALYDATTKARKHYLAVERKVRERVKKANPDLEWWQQADLVEKDTEVIDANGRLQGLCQACNLIGIESGE